MSAPRAMRLALPWLLIVAAGLLAAWLRFGLIEPPALAHQCDGGAGPAWCAWRLLAVRGFLSYAYGIAALAAAALALVWRHPFAAWLAAALGAIALVLYCANAGAPALLLGCLRLLRSQSAGVDEHRRGDRHAQAQP